MEGLEDVERMECLMVRMVVTVAMGAMVVQRGAGVFAVTKRQSAGFQIALSLETVWERAPVAMEEMGETAVMDHWVAMCGVTVVMEATVATRGVPAVLAAGEYGMTVPVNRL